MNTPYIPSPADISDLKAACGYPQKTPRPDLNEFAARCHNLALSWWLDPITKAPIERNPRELLMLAISEIAEAMEGERKNLMDDHLPDRRMAEVECADFVIRLGDFAGGFDVHIETPSFLGASPPFVPPNKGEALYRLTASVFDLLDSDPDGWMQGEHFGYSIALAESYCEKHGYDLWAAVECKLRYNQYRADHKPENRIQPGGKSF